MNTSWNRRAGSGVSLPVRRLFCYGLRKLFRKNGFQIDLDSYAFRNMRACPDDSRCIRDGQEIDVAFFFCCASGRDPNPMRQESVILARSWKLGMIWSFSMIIPQFGQEDMVIGLRIASVEMVVGDCFYGEHVALFELCKMRSERRVGAVQQPCHRRRGLSVQSFR